MPICTNNFVVFLDEKLREIAMLPTLLNRHKSSGAICEVSVMCDMIFKMNDCEKTTIFP